MTEHSTTEGVAGIDVGKAFLDIHIHGLGLAKKVENRISAYAGLVAWLREHNVERVGLEASGGYERDVTAFLREAGFAVRLFQPIQVKSFAMTQLRRVKNDHLDAALIAECTFTLGEGRPAADPRYEDLADHLTYIEQLEDDLVRFKTRLESCRLKRLQQAIQDDIDRRKKQREDELRKLANALAKHEDLALRLELAESVPGVGRRTALSAIIRLPELGSVTREQIAALVGVAPYDDDSGKRRGYRHTIGGRDKVRTSLYAAAMPAAYHWNPELIAFRKRLTEKGKSHKVTMIACVRKLIIFINAVLARMEPWAENPPKHPVEKPAI